MRGRRAGFKREKAVALSVEREQENRDAGADEVRRNFKI